MLLCVHRFPEHPRSHASLCTTPSGLQYHAARLPGASYDVHPACRSVSRAHLDSTSSTNIVQQCCRCLYCFCIDVSVPLLALLTAAQSMGPRPATAAAAAAAPVRGVPQYKYAAGVRNPQQHMTAQPQVSMQQVGCTFLLISSPPSGLGDSLSDLLIFLHPQPAVHVQGQEPLTASMLAAAPPQEQKQMLGKISTYHDS